VRRHRIIVGTEEEASMVSTSAKSLIREETVTRLEAFSDEDLLEQFLRGEDLESQDAFRALVKRHGPRILAICRHVLDREHDAEDAFQATFLTLARKGASIRNRRAFAGWLHEVAYRVALRAHADASRRRIIEKQAMMMAPPRDVPGDPDEIVYWNELRPMLQEEVVRLPEKYRVPVVLSYLEGKTNEEVAELLQWPVGTVKGRLLRARQLLRSRLSQRGVALSVAFLVTALSRGRVRAAVAPAELITRTVRLANPWRPRAMPPDSTSSPPPPLAKSGPPTRAESLAKLDLYSARWARLALVSFLLSVIVSSLYIGTSWAATGGSFAGLRSVFSGLVPARGESPGSCH
jgi:RNA polymerase sigma factor (sigma-70 family)